MPTTSGATCLNGEPQAPGGRLQLADVVLQQPVPEQALDRVELWTG